MKSLSILGKARRYNIILLPGSPGIKNKYLPDTPYFEPPLVRCGGPGRSDSTSDGSQTD